MKKLLLALAGVGTIAGATASVVSVSSCGTSKDYDITFRIAASETDIYTPLVEQFEKASGLKVKIIEGEDNPDKSLLDSKVANKLPSVTLMGSLSTAKKEGLTAPFTYKDLFDKKTFVDGLGEWKVGATTGSGSKTLDTQVADHYDKGLLDSTMYNGKLYGYTVGSTGWGVWYNVDQLKTTEHIDKYLITTDTTHEGTIPVSGKKDAGNFYTCSETDIQDFILDSANLTKANTGITATHWYSLGWTGMVQRIAAVQYNCMKTPALWDSFPRQGVMGENFNLTNGIPTMKTSSDADAPSSFDHRWNQKALAGEFQKDKAAEQWWYSSMIYDAAFAKGANKEKGLITAQEGFNNNNDPATRFWDQTMGGDLHRVQPSMLAFGQLWQPWSVKNKSGFTKTKSWAIPFASVGLGMYGVGAGVKKGSEEWTNSLKLIRFLASETTAKQTAHKLNSTYIKDGKGYSSVLAEAITGEAKDVKEAKLKSAINFFQSTKTQLETLRTGSDSLALMEQPGYAKVPSVFTIPAEGEANFEQSQSDLSKGAIAWRGGTMPTTFTDFKTKMKALLAKYK